MTTNYLLLLVLEQLLRLRRDVHVDAPVLQLAVLEDEEAPLRLGLEQRAEERLSRALGGGLRRAVLNVERRAAHVAADELRVLEGLLLGLQERVLAAAALRRRRRERAVRQAAHEVGLALDRAADGLRGANLYSLRELVERDPALVRGQPGGVLALRALALFDFLFARRRREARLERCCPRDRAAGGLEASCRVQEPKRHDKRAWHAETSRGQRSMSAGVLPRLRSMYERTGATY